MDMPCDITPQLTRPKRDAVRIGHARPGQQAEMHGGRGTRIGLAADDATPESSRDYKFARL
jgi:hypothetical protein